MYLKNEVLFMKMKGRNITYIKILQLYGMTLKKKLKQRQA